ncbi:sugar phosphate isomerase/epimerase family protein [Novosphingobium sp. B 225]|uniref:sugar phosphate isomerase/epimerase family protein n=1 Tax=Novosphingobium sp. B 225 TaxID=1961849 RepID=UPI000B4B0985|nr:sugar phosphate isomerase/epimerase [Novosphingobium sp. B 225]
MTPQQRVLYSGSQRLLPVQDRLAHARAAGFDAVSIWPSDVRDADLSELRAAVAAAGLTVSEMEVLCCWLPGQAEAPPSMWDMLKWQTPERMLPMAQALGAHTISAAELFGLPFHGPAMAATFKALCQRAADHGLRVALEFVPSGGIFGLAEAWEIVERAGANNGGLMIDSCHFHTSQSSLDLLASIPGDRIYSVQLADVPADADAQMVNRMQDRLMPGAGVIDFAAFMQALAATGTTAPTGIEMFSAALDALPPAESARQCAAALDFCLSQGTQT